MVVGCRQRDLVDRAASLLGGTLPWTVLAGGFMVATQDWGWDGKAISARGPSNPTGVGSRITCENL